MPTYLYRGSYTPSGVAGLLKEGGSGRLAAAAALIESVGGSVESNHWAFGADDFFIIAELPDAASAAAAALAVGASGAVNLTTTPLLTAAEVDAAVAKSPDYRPPGA
jgi:uncharacterized protein with GYD domain